MKTAFFYMFKCFGKYFIAAIIILPQYAYSYDSGSLINGGFDWSSRKTRIEIAFSLLEHITQLSSQIPIQKPQELVWLKEEGDALAAIPNSSLSKRFSDLYDSPEHNHRKLKQHLAGISEALECIKEQKVRVPREMMCWSVASSMLADNSIFADSITSLINSGRLTKDVEKNRGVGPRSLGYGYFFSIYGRGVMEYIITPYLIKQSN